MNNITVGSLFAGIGGICLAFKQEGCNVKWANEYNKHACTTYRFNQKKELLGEETRLIEKDISLLDNDLINKKKERVKKVDIITSGFPCQAFSVAGYREGFSDKKGRGNFFFKTASFIEKLKPKAFLLENVKNLEGHDNGNTLNIIKKTIKNDLNYSFIKFVLNAKDCGNIPQNRDRIYIVGFRGEAKYSNNDDPNYKLKKQIATHHFKIPEKLIFKKHTHKKTIHDILDTSKQNERFYYTKEHKYYKTLIKEMKRKETIYQWRRVYVRENKNNVCPTLTANMGTGGHNVPLVIDDYGIRKLTPNECLRFQGFPSGEKGFKFPEDLALSHCYKQAGNSVVVPVVRRIANEIVRVLNLKYGKQ